MTRPWNAWFLPLRKNKLVNVHQFRLVLFSVGWAFLFLMASGPLCGQNNIPSGQKSMKEKKTRPKHPPRDPKKASLMALMPGLGQIYNHKFWKVPIVYTGFGVIGYFAVTNTQQYRLYKAAYNCKTNNPQCDDPLAEKYSKETLQYIRDYYRRNMQLSYIVGGAWYLLQIIDANVDAHLSHWNISDNLSLDVSPVYQPVGIFRQPAYQGVNLRFSF